METPTPIRSTVEILALIAFVILIPPLLESLAVQHGVPTKGLSRIAVTGALFAAIGALVWVLLTLRGETFADIGLRRPGSWARTFILGATLAACLFVALELLMSAGLVSRERLGDMASELKGNLTLALARIAFSLFVVGFAEELLFRGFILDRIAKAFGGSGVGTVIAVVGQAVLFGLSHGYQKLDGMLFTGGVGLIFGITFVASRRNLWPVIIAHSLFDGARAAYLYFGG